MRLTIINQYYPPDVAPTGQLAASLAEHRAQQGDEVTIITSRGGYGQDFGAQRRDEQAGNPSVRRIWTPQLGKKNILTRCIDYACFYVGALWKMITSPKQDVIISLTTPPYIAWTAVAHRIIHPRTRLILWNMDCYPDAPERLDVIKPGGFVSRMLRALSRCLYSRMDEMVALDHAMADLLAQYTPSRDASAVRVIPNWEPVDRFGERTEWPAADELGLHDQFVVLYFGNAGYGHHFDTILDAAERLRDEAVTFLFVGGGKRVDELRAEVDRRSLTNVVLHGFVPIEETAGVLSAANCALITLRDESLGVMSPSKLHSSLAMGLPIAYVGPAGSNVDHAIREHECGRSLRIGDVDGLVGFIDELRHSEEAQMSYHARAKRAFINAYSDRSVLPQFDEMIDTAFSNRESRSLVSTQQSGGTV